jgi:hypothetical protein
VAFGGSSPDPIRTLSSLSNSSALAGAPSPDPLDGSTGPVRTVDFFPGRRTRRIREGFVILWQIELEQTRTILSRFHCCPERASGFRKEREKTGSFQKTPFETITYQLVRSGRRNKCAPGDEYVDALRQAAARSDTSLPHPDLAPLTGGGAGGGWRWKGTCDRSIRRPRPPSADPRLRLTSYLGRDRTP